MLLNNIPHLRGNYCELFVVRGTCREKDFSEKVFVVMGLGVFPDVGIFR